MHRIIRLHNLLQKVVAFLQHFLYHYLVVYPNKEKLEETKS